MSVVEWFWFVDEKIKAFSKVDLIYNVISQSNDILEILERIFLIMFTALNL